MGSVLLIFKVFCVVLLCVFMFRVPCCDVRYDFSIITMFGSSLPPVLSLYKIVRSSVILLLPLFIVCRRAQFLFMLFVFVSV